MPASFTSALLDQRQFHFRRPVAVECPRHGNVRVDRFCHLAAHQCPAAVTLL
ncbi:DUF723 domain-containing protein [Sinorhizobium meliloti]|uniref:DUF723 domain-containing protein n=1 Tax=Rhizobium meliloti TaxID=382 RepID=UPI000FDC3986|nr:DUF723 domain-containing protein [Sinorhizobium meliloti]RVM86356.1 DUF723 domain-containing protein [Sinorhizobium meliloti]